MTCLKCGSILRKEVLDIHHIDRQLEKANIELKNMDTIKSNYLQQDMLLEIVEEFHLMLVKETCMDCWVRLIHVIFEEDALVVNPLYHLRDRNRITSFLCFNLPNRE
jgi:hypothetical protein